MAIGLREAVEKVLLNCKFIFKKMANKSSTFYNKKQKNKNQKNKLTKINKNERKKETKL